MLVEILSPTNRPKTWTNVWTYSSIPSVQEILVLHTNPIAAELLRRCADGTWPERVTVNSDGELVLDSIDFRVPLAELYVRTRLAR